LAAIDVDSDNWDEKVLGSQIPVIVDFWAPWCPWCKRLMPDFESLSDEYRGRLAFTKLNADESPDIASRYGVQGLPTLKFFCAGRPIAEIVGFLPRNSLKVQLDGMLSMYKDCLDQSSPMR
jgi:thioredoxin 1